MKTLEELTQTIAQMNHWPATKMLPFVVSEFPSIQREYDACEATSRKRFEDLQSTEARCVELQAEVRKWMDKAQANHESFCRMKQERDAIQLRLHAIDHAYNEQQKRVVLPGAFLTYAEQPGSIDKLKALVERQRQFIRTLYTSRNKKKAK